MSDAKITGRGASKAEPAGVFTEKGHKSNLMESKPEHGANMSIFNKLNMTAAAQVILIFILLGLTYGCVSNTGEQKEEPIAKTSEIGGGILKTVNYENEPVILINLNGTYHAYLGKCPSGGGAAFDNNSTVNNTLICPGGAVFDFATGNYLGHEDGKDLNLSSLLELNVSVDGEDIYISEKLQEDDCGNKRCGAGESDKNCCSDCGCKSGKCVENKCVEIKAGISTDKKLYQSKQVANITLSINSSEKLNNVTAKVYGISARGKYYLNTQVKMNLSAGENIKSITYNMPSCTGCAGIRPGTYKINCDVLYNNEIIGAAEKDIDIKQ